MSPGGRRPSAAETAPYRPLSALLERAAATVAPPLVVAIGGSVAAGKTTIAETVVALVRFWPSHPRVALVGSDGFLLPNAVLADRGLVHRKGFPESYDRARLVGVLGALKDGAPSVAVPVYSHVTYDVVPGAQVELHRPDVVVVEGLGLLPPAGGADLRALLDVTVYVDAPEALIEQWYSDRFRALCRAARDDPASFYARFADLDDAALVDLAHHVWEGINLPNLRAHIAPGRQEADVVVEKGEGHRLVAIRERLR